MMISEDDLYRVGSMNGQLVVYDPDVQLDGSPHVAFYFRMHEKYVIYTKVQARAIIKNITKEHKEYSLTISHYKAWLNTDNKQKIISAQEEVRVRDNNHLFRIGLLKQKHRNYVEGSGREYIGVSETPIHRGVRTTVCHSCHRTISNDINLNCNRCGWIICPKCMICGCGYIP